MHARWIAPSWLAIFASTAWAQSPAVLGKNDAAFARLLYGRFHYSDLAEKMCNAIEKGGKAGGDELVGIKALHLDLRLDIARGEPDLFKRKDQIKTILQEKEDLIRQYRGSKEAEEASNTLPDVYRSLGETITAAVQREKDLGLVAQLQDEGQKIYGQAEDALKARIEALKADHASPQADQQYMVALYNLPRTYYFHSLLYPAGEWKKKDLLENAIEGFTNFELDYKDSILYYEGLIYMGLCQKELGKNDEALDCFRDVIALGDGYDAVNGVHQMPPEVADVVSAGALQKVLMQTDLKDFSGAIETSKKFIATTAEALESRQGLAVLAAEANAELLAGDSKAANETAQKLVEADDRGPWGAKGRDIQSKIIQGGGTGLLGPSDVLKIAQSMFGRGDLERALQVCHQAIASARGTDKEASLAIDAYMLIGAIFTQRGWNNEAALAFDAAGERYPNGEKAPEAVYRALQTYVRLNSEDKKPFYKKRIDDRMKTLSTRYPNHPRAAYAQIVEGQQLEGEAEFLKAAEKYTKVTPGAPSYLEAQFKAGNVYFLQARKLILTDKKPAEAKQYVSQAETLLKKAIVDLDLALKGTLDLEAQSRLEHLGFLARTSLAQLYLLPGVDRPGEVLPVLADVDEKFGNDPEKLSTAWGLRISALQAQGKLEEAVKLLDALVQKDPESRAIGGAAGQVARALDQQAEDLRKANKAHDADEMQKRAARYYSMSGRALLKGDVIRSSVVEEIANRLYALGLHFNEVPDSQTTFVGWSPKQTKDSTLWQQAVELYQAALRVSPNSQTTINLGRCLGFLGRYAEAAAVYGQLFDTEVLYDREAKRFNSALIKTKPELIGAYIEWGVSEHEAALQDQDHERFLRASGIFDNLVRGLSDTSSKLWWQAKYYQIKSLVDQGNYDTAGFLMSDLVRTTQDLGASVGLKSAFEAMKTELDQKTFPHPSKSEPQKSEPPKKSSAPQSNKPK